MNMTSKTLLIAALTVLFLSPYARAQDDFNVVKVNAAKIKLQLRSPDIGATFSLQKGVVTSSITTTGAVVGANGATAMAVGVGAATSEQYDRVCTAPCEVELAAGLRRWKVELPDGSAAVTNNILLQQDATLTATYNSRSTAQSILGYGGMAVFFGGLGSGLYLASQGKMSGVYLGTGSVVLASILWGVAMGIHDSVDVRVDPAQ